MPPADGVRTGHIQFVGRNALAFVQDLDGALVVFAAVAENVGEDHDIFHLAQLGQLLVEKGASSDVLQSDRVEHSRRSFVQARGRIAGHRLRRQSLHHEAAELVQMHHIFELNSVAEGSAGGDHRILQLDAGEADAEIRGGSGGGSGHREALAAASRAGRWRRSGARRV